MQHAQGKTWWWHTGGPGKVLQLSWVMEGCPQGAHTSFRMSGHRAAWLHVGQGTVWGGSCLAYLGGHSWVLPSQGRDTSQAAGWLVQEGAETSTGRWHVGG